MRLAKARAHPSDPMSSYVSAALRRVAAAHADFLCEYCLIHEDDTVFGCEVDHFISTKHGGMAEADNLAYARAFCNRPKGSDTGSVVQGTEAYVRFFHPCLDRWAEHFRLDGVVIVDLSDVGEVTGRILAFNTSERLLERQVLLEAGRYPSAAALARMTSLA